MKVHEFAEKNLKLRDLSFAKTYLLYQFFMMNVKN